MPPKSVDCCSLKFSDLLCDSAKPSFTLPGVILLVQYVYILLREKLRPETVKGFFFCLYLFISLTDLVPAGLN